MAATGAEDVSCCGKTFAGNFEEESAGNFEGWWAQMVLSAERPAGSGFVVLGLQFGLGREAVEALGGSASGKLG